MYRRERKEEDLPFVRVEVAFSNLNDAIDRCSRRCAVRTDTMARVTNVHVHVTTWLLILNTIATVCSRHVVLVFIVGVTNTTLGYRNDTHVLREVLVKDILAREGVLAPPRSGLAGVTSTANLLGNRPLEREINTHNELMRDDKRTVYCE